MIALLVAGVLGALAPQEGPPAEAAALVLARVDGRPLTLADALEVFLSTHTGHGVLVRGEPALRELVGRLIERDLFLAEAEALGIPEDPQVTGALEAYRDELVVRAFWRREVDERVQVDDEAVESFYAKTDVALKLTLIETAQRADCERLRARVEAGEDMAALASSESQHPSRSLGGLLPYVRRGEIEPELEPAVFALEQPGALTPVVATRRGFAFARLEERSVNPTRLPREVALPQIKKILRDREEDRLRAEAEARLERAGAVELVAAALEPGAVLDSGGPETAVAHALGKTLTLAELRDALDLEALRAAEPATVADAARFVARDWALRTVILAEASEKGTEEDGAEAALLRRRRDLLMQVLCERYVWPGDEPGEEELRAYYEQHKAESFTRPPERRLAYIVVASREEADALLAKLEAGEDFEALARTVSLDRASAVHGGRIGWIKQGEILPAVEERAFALPKGALDGPIETEQGWFLVQVLDRREPELVPFEGARAAVLKRLVQERQRAAYAGWAAKLRERAAIELDEEGVRAAVEWLDRQPVPEQEPAPAGSPHAPQGGRGD